MNGILNVYKEAGFTSFDVVAKLRKITGQKKIGHTGTLDPDAEGVLPVCLGSATKLCGLLTEKEKTYRAVMLLGVTTDTQDISGTVLEKRSVTVSGEEIRDVLLNFIGGYDQTPPMYSAVRVGGRRLYELAREGKEVERPPRRVKILDLEIHYIEVPEVCFTVSCSSGTYIRTLCRDAGERLGCGACLKSLLRTRVDRFTADEALKLSQIEERFRSGLIDEVLLPVDAVFADSPAVRMKPEGDRLVRNGNGFGPGDTVNTDVSESLRGRVRVYDSEGRFIGLYTRKDTQIFKPEKMFLQ